MRIFGLILLTAGAVGVVLLRRWNRELERAVALPVYHHPSVVGSLSPAHAEALGPAGFPSGARYLSPRAFERAALPPEIRRTLS